jgi:hypothetical protein
VATLVVNNALSLTLAPVNTNACFGGSASFSVSAVGTDVAYQWFFGTNELANQTNTTLTITNAKPADAGAYNVVVTGACGEPIIRSANLTVGALPTIACVADKIVPLGVAWTFDTPTANYPITVFNTVTNFAGHCGTTFDAVRTWVASDLCGNDTSCTQKVTVVDTAAPTVAITSPTNGAIFLAPATFPVVAQAQDSGGVVSQVEFFQGTTSLGVVTNPASYSVVASSLPVGSYTFRAVATDGCGNMATSAPVVVSVVASLPLTVSGPIKLNFQTGYWEQTAHITNPTLFTFSAVGVLVENLPNAWRVQNATMSTNGIPVVLYNNSVAPGTSVDIKVQYYLGAGASTNASPTLVAIQMEPVGTAAALGTQVPITRGMFLSDGTFLLNFNTVAGATYQVQYTADLQHWKAAAFTVSGTGYSAQWIDYGAPVTDGFPRSVPIRLYRVMKTQ